MIDENLLFNRDQSNLRLEREAGGNHEKAAHHAHTASGHAYLATHHGEEAGNAHMDEHGKK